MFSAPLSRDGPGLLLRDIAKGEDPQILATAAVIALISPDILLLTDFDYDHDQLALSAFAQLTGYSHSFSAQPNTGIPTGFDIDQNARLNEARDAQGYGRFRGDGGMAVLSRYPIALEDVANLSTLLWRDLAGATLPEGEPATVAAVQRLSSVAHWVLPINAPEGMLYLLAFSATPPVFDGPEDRNGLRNRDELRLWSAVLDGHYGPPPQNFVVLGNANLDPQDGDGLGAVMQAFLDDPRLQDPRPQSAGAKAAADPDHIGDPALDTVDWADGRPGNLRVGYVLPAATWRVVDAGVFWPAPDHPDAAILGKDGLAAGPHRLVWVDIAR